MATPNQLPAKSPIEDKYRSRIKITYRTNISGTPVAQTLPFRVLVLGEFLGATARKAGLLDDLSARKVRSIEMGDVNAGVEAFMREMIPWMRIPVGTTGDLRRRLEAPVPGQVTLTNLTIPSNPDYDKTSHEATVTVSGTATFTSTAAQNGVVEIKDAPIASVTGTLTLTQGTPFPTPKDDLSLQLSGSLVAYFVDPSATSKSAPLIPFTALFAPVGQDDPKSGAPSVTVTISKDKIKIGDGGEITFSVGPADPSKPLVADATAARTIPFPNLRAFSPDGVAASIPELQRLSVIRDLVLELQSNLRNNQALQSVVRNAFKGDVLGAVKAFVAQYPNASSDFNYLRLVPNPPPTNH